MSMSLIPAIYKQSDSKYSFDEVVTSTSFWSGFSFRILLATSNPEGLERCVSCIIPPYGLFIFMLSKKHVNAVSPLLAISAFTSNEDT